MDFVSHSSKLDLAKTASIVPKEVQKLAACTICKLIMNDA
jgi:hypothetical protein